MSIWGPKDGQSYTVRAAMILVFFHDEWQAKVNGTSPESSVDKPVLPDWLSRGGASEAVEVGASLRERYDKLKVSAGAMCDEVLPTLIAFLNQYV